jgi:hypothetical protein
MADMKKAFFIALCAALVTAGALAEEGFATGFGEGFASAPEGSSEDGFESGFGEDFGSGFGEEDGAGGDAESFGDGGFGGFADSFGAADETSSPLSIGGRLSLPVRAYVGDADDDQETDCHPEGAVELKYESAKAGATLDFSVMTDEVELNELSLRYYGSALLAEAGYMKRVWGKGDEYHVVNLMNPRNLEDFTNGGEYIEWVDPEVMLSLSLPVRQMGQLELLYAPRFTADVVPSAGRWSPYQAGALAGLVEECVSYQALVVYNSTLADTGSEAAASLAQTAYLSENSDADALSPDTEGWDWSQFAVYYTDTFGSVDLGLMYYYGYYGQPAVNAEYSGTQISSLELDYNRMQAFGLDFGAVIGPFNTRGELAWYMTDDFSGDDRELYNNRIKWVGGFDVNLPVSSLNLNIQEAGTYIMGHDEIDAFDMEYDEDGDYTENLVILKISDHYNHEKVEASVTGIYHIEKKGWKIAPDIKVDLSDDLELEAEYCAFGGDEENSLFGQFDDNDYLEIQLSYSF